MAKYTSDGAGNLQCCSNMAIKQSEVTTCQGSPDRLEYTHTHIHRNKVSTKKKKIPTDFSCNLISRVKVFHHDIYC